MDLARDPRALLGDRAPELGEADRAPHADEEEAVGEQAEEVALRDEVARELGLEHVVQLGEERQGRAEREPAVEVLAVAAVADREADRGGEREQRQDRQRDRQLERPGDIAARLERGEPRRRTPRSGSQIVSRAASSTRDPDEAAPGCGCRSEGARIERREGDQGRGQHPGAERGPGLRSGLRVAAEHRQRPRTRACRRRRRRTRLRGAGRGRGPRRRSGFAVRIATIVAARTTAVSSTSRPSGSS